MERVRRPGYRLIYSTETPDHVYYAIFDAGDDRLAFCELDNRPPPFIRIISTSITTAKGKDVRGEGKRLVRSLLWIHDVEDGYEYPIERGVVGKLRVRHRIGFRKVFDEKIDWGQP